jgi:hypothetical protein
LSKPHVQKYIYDLTAPLLDKLAITRERVLREYSAIAFSRLSDYVNDDYSVKNISEIEESKIPAMGLVEVDEESRQSADSDAVITRRKVKFKLHDKLKALDKLYDVLHPEQQQVKAGEGGNLFMQLNQYFNNK